MERRALAIPALDVWIKSETKVATIVKAHKVRGNLFSNSKPKSMSCSCSCFIAFGPLQDCSEKRDVSSSDKQEGTNLKHIKCKLIRLVTVCFIIELYLKCGVGSTPSSYGNFFRHDLDLLLSIPWNTKGVAA